MSVWGAFNLILKVNGDDYGYGISLLLKIAVLLTISLHKVLPATL